jgi:hypothetical protein
MDLRAVLSPEDYLIVESELESLVHRAKLCYACVREREADSCLARSAGHECAHHEVACSISVDDLWVELEVGAPDDADPRLLDHSLESSRLYLGALFRAVVRMVRAGRGRTIPPLRA